MGSALGQELVQLPWTRGFGGGGLKLQSQKALAPGTLEDSGLSKPVPQGQGCLDLYCAPMPGAIFVGCHIESWGSLNVHVGL